MYLFLWLRTRSGARQPRRRSLTQPNEFRHPRVLATQVTTVTLYFAERTQKEEKAPTKTFRKKWNVSRYVHPVTKSRTPPETLRIFPELSRSRGEVKRQGGESFAVNNH